MFQLWGKLYRNGKMVQDMVACVDREDTRTHRIFDALNQICDAWNLARPLWLDANIAEFRRRSRTRFGQDQFIETIDFDYLEIQILEE